MKKISWTYRVKNEEVLLRVEEEKNLLHTIKRRKDNWVGHIWRENCLLKLVIEGKIEGTGRRGRGHAQLLYDLEEIRRSWKLKEGGLDRALWRTRPGRSRGLVRRATTWWCARLNGYAVCMRLEKFDFKNLLPSAYVLQGECVFVYAKVKRKCFLQWLNSYKSFPWYRLVL